MDIFFSSRRQTSRRSARKAPSRRDRPEIYLEMIFRRHFNSMLFRNVSGEYRSLQEKPEEHLQAPEPEDEPPPPPALESRSLAAHRDNCPDRDYSSRPAEPGNEEFTEADYELTKAAPGFHPCTIETGDDKPQTTASDDCITALLDYTRVNPSKRYLLNSDFREDMGERVYGMQIISRKVDEVTEETDDF